MAIRFLPDEPITENKQDILKYRSFAQLIKESLKQTRTPFVYGVLGDWGSGKTSTLKLLEEMLSFEEVGGCQFVPIWFNAWKYENDVNMVYPLLHQIKNAHDSLQKLAEGDRVAFKKSFFKVVGASALALTDLGLRAVTHHATGEALKMGDVKDYLKTVENKLDAVAGALADWTDKVAELEKVFASLIEQFAADYAKNHEIAQERIRFVILIDDLDRCLPDRALAILESIKNFLSVPRCIYILAINPEMVYAGIQSRFHGTVVSGREYLEKILNYSFYVPEPSPESILEFSTTQLIGLVTDPEKQNELNNSFSEFGKVLNECRFTNPRKIKRIFNRYLFFLGLFEKELDKYELSNVAKFIIMAEYFPDLFQTYLADGSAPTQLRALGTNGFDLKKFELETGISLEGSYAQLSRMKTLFQLYEPLPAENKAKVCEHASAVFSIARLK